MLKSPECEYNRHYYIILKMSPSTEDVGGSQATILHNLHQKIREMNTTSRDHHDN